MGEIQKNDKQLSMDFSPESAGNTEKAGKKEVTAITEELEKPKFLFSVNVTQHHITS